MNSGIQRQLQKVNGPETIKIIDYDLLKGKIKLSFPQVKLIPPPKKK